METAHFIAWVKGQVKAQMGIDFFRKSIIILRCQQGQCKPAVSFRRFKAQCVWWKLVASWSSTSTNLVDINHRIQIGDNKSGIQCESPTSFFHFLRPCLFAILWSYLSAGPPMMTEASLARAQLAGVWFGRDPLL